MKHPQFFKFLGQRNKASSLTIPNKCPVRKSSVDKKNLGGDWISSERATVTQSLWVPL